MNTIDLRSDTVTKPSPAMLEAMIKVDVGDDVYGEDPTVNRLEEIAAKKLGFEKALFCTSGTQSNLLGLLTHCGRGDEYIVGQHAHTYLYEGGGAAVLGSIQPQPLIPEPDGTLDLDKVKALIKPDDYHFAMTRLFCLENTHKGKVLPLDYLENARSFANRHGLKLHLDGARIFNAAVKLDCDVKEITQYFDTVSCCLSKGLGAPVGSVLCGPRKMIKSARRWRKMVGGGMRQAGFLAAAGIFALENNIERLKKDHDNARTLAQRLNAMENISIDMNMVQTNILFVSIQADIPQLCQYLKDRNIIIDEANPTRMVTHLDISAEDIDRAIEAFEDFFKSRSH
jgi:threonine aldolase